MEKNNINKKFMFLNLYIINIALQMIEGSSSGAAAVMPTALCVFMTCSGCVYYLMGWVKCRSNFSSMGHILYIVYSTIDL